MRREAFLSVGGFDTDFRTGYEDYNLYLSCLERGYQFYRIPEELFLYRIREKSTTTEMLSDANKLISSRIMLYEKHRPLFDAHGIDCAAFVRNVVHLISERNNSLLAAANANTEAVKQHLEKTVAEWTNTDRRLQEANARVALLDG